MDSLLGSFIPISIASLVLYVALQTLSYNRTNSLKAPVVGRYSVLEPEWLLRLRYIGNAWDMLAEGYGRVHLCRSEDLAGRFNELLVQRQDICCEAL